MRRSTAAALGTLTGAARGFYRSSDNGTTWVDVTSNAPTDSDAIRVMEGDLRTFGKFYIGTEGRGIFAAVPQ